MHIKENWPFPGLIEKIAKQWGLSELKQVENLSFHHVLAGFRGHEAIILKVGETLALAQEVAALQAFAGLGAVKLLEQQETAILLERAIPGQTLKSFFPDKDNQACQIFYQLMTRLHQAPIAKNHAFPDIKDWLSVLDTQVNIPQDYLAHARKLRQKLLNTSMQPVLAHGDLHHDNILQNGDSWLAIDPKGVIAYPVNEIWPFISNPKIKLQPDILLSRINDFAQLLNLNRQTIIEWCFVQSVLAWIWDIEDHIDPQSIYLTEFFYNLAIVRLDF